MPRGISKTREAMALFLNPDTVPPEMRPKGRGTKSIKVTVLQENAKQVMLQYTYKPSPRAKNVMHCRATFPADAVVLYELEAVEMDTVEAPTPTKAAPAEKRVGKKKATPAKKGAATTPTPTSSTGKAVLKTLRANKGPMKMPELVEETEFTAPQLRKALSELVEEGIVEKEGAARSMTYGIKRKKRKGAAKKKAAPKKKGKKGKKKSDDSVKKGKKKGKKRRGRKSLDDAPSSAPAKKVKKGKKKGKKTRFGSSRRKSSFKLDPEDD